jgi:hypothetical protein
MGMSRKFVIFANDRATVGRDVELHNHLKLKLVYVIFKNSVRTSKRTSHFTTTKINWLTLFKEIIPVYTNSHTRPINIKCRVIDW